MSGTGHRKHSAGGGPGGRWRGSARLRTLAFLLGISSFLVVPPGACSQDAARAGFRRYTVEQGLSQGTANSILQDHEGFMWIGTLDGLNRFDGVECRNFYHNPSDTASLSNSWISSIHEDERQRLWVGTRAGLNEYDRVTERFRRYPLRGPDGRLTYDYVVGKIQSTTGGRTTRVVVASSGIYEVDDATRSLVPLDDATLDSTLRWGANGRVAWCAQHDSLFALGNKGGLAAPAYVLAKGSIQAVVQTTPAPQVLLIGTTSGLEVFDPAAGRSVRIDSIPPTYVIIDEGGGRFLLGTSDGVWTLERVKTGRGGSPAGIVWKSARTGLEGLTILSICRDSSGALWAGSNDGLYRRLTSSPAFTVYRHRDDDPNSLASDFVMPIVEDRRGRIWIGTFDRGVSLLTPGGAGGPRFRNFSIERGPEGASTGTNVRSMVETQDGMIWMGTNRGLEVCSPEPRFISRYSNLGDGIDISLWFEALYETKDGTLWGGTPPLRLIRIDRAAGRQPVFKPFYLMDTSRTEMSTAVHTIIEGEGGRLWVGTESGLFRFDPASGGIERFHRENDHGLSNNFVWSLLPTTEGGREVLWVGTSQGLNRFVPSTGEWTSYFRQEGFPSDWIYGIIRDSRGRLWLTTNRGITCFDDSRPAGSKFRNFDATDGIAGDECNRRSYAGLKGGDIVFGGTRGVTRFNPLSLRDNRHVPPVVLTSVLNAGAPMSFPVPVCDLKELRVGHDVNDLAFRFAALDYANPPRNQYAYRMEGHEAGWTHIGNRRDVSFAGLSPGHYVFRVKASNNDGLWNERGLAVAVVIEPPYWQTWWFNVAGLVALVLGIVGYFRLREVRAKEIFNMRRTIARDLHDEIGSNLTGIAVSGSLLKESGGLTTEQETRIADITSIAVRTAELMRDLIWVIRPESDRLDDLGFRIKDAANGILAGTRCHFNIPENLAGHGLGLEVKHNLYLIYKEIITNIARHAKAREVTVSLDLTGRELALTVTDDGVGFEPRPEPSGMGLKNLAARASSIGGTVKVVSKPGGGTTVVVTVPFT